MHMQLLISLKFYTETNEEIGYNLFFELCATEDENK